MLVLYRGYGYFLLKFVNFVAFEVGLHFFLFCAGWEVQGMASLDACPIPGVWLLPFNFVSFVGLRLACTFYFWGGARDGSPECLSCTGGVVISF